MNMLANRDNVNQWWKSASTHLWRNFTTYDDSQGRKDDSDETGC